MPSCIVRWRARVRGQLPLLVPVVAVGVATLVAQSRFDAIAPLDLERLLASNLPNALHGTVWYLRKLVWPTDLAVHYPHPGFAWAGGVPLRPLALLASLGVLVAISVAVVRLRRTGYLPFGWLWFLVALAPVAGVVQGGSQAGADRYAYGRRARGSRCPAPRSARPGWRCSWRSARPRPCRSATGATRGRSTSARSR